VGANRERALSDVSSRNPAVVGRSKDCRPALKALDHVSREVRVTTATLSQWRDEFLAAGQAGLKSKPTTATSRATRTPR
jgi:hypothetical protein